MAKYSIEDIEILCKKADLSYREAVDLLENSDGSLSRAFGQLEAEGRIRSASAGNRRSVWNKIGSLLESLFCFRVHISSNSHTVLNISILTALAVLLLKPIIPVLGAAACILLGYRCTFERRSADFTRQELRKNLIGIGNAIRKKTEELSGRLNEKDHSGRDE